MKGNFERATLLLFRRFFSFLVFSVSLLIRRLFELKNFFSLPRTRTHVRHFLKLISFFCIFLLKFFEHRFSIRLCFLFDALSRLASEKSRQNIWRAISNECETLPASLGWLSLFSCLFYSFVLLGNPCERSGRYPLAGQQMRRCVIESF